ncbi:hypothetical protein NQ129_21545 [Priestia aryabhattai]|uniref:hypothetical protein n=1 Tax=Priestia aryabhattai TaxID=412384 RepID=UPI00211BBF17|nr:hypothetical protein [Priestia aryabhattai]MCQ9284374.1 hypothetical protein [Priestia aryabhattai]
MIGGKDADSCGKSGTGETPQAHKRRGGSSAARGKRSLARKSTAGQQAVQLMSAFVRLWIMLQLLLIDTEILAFMLSYPCLTK